MAREITFSASLNASKGGARVTVAESAVVDMTGDDMIQATQLIGTAAELLDIGEISGQPVVVFIKNLDATNYVEVDQNADMARSQTLRAGRHTLIIEPKLPLYLKANTAAVRVAFAAVEA